MELSIIIPTFNEAKNVPQLIDKIKEIFSSGTCSYELIIADAGSTDGTLELAREKKALAFRQKEPGYGAALKEAVKLAKGKYIVTLDADFSHNPYIIKRLLACRRLAHIIIASRYTRGGLANMPFWRKAMSIILNRAMCFGLSLPLTDISSGFRLYNAEVFREVDFSERNFSVLVEILVKAYINGFNIKEVPFHYQPRGQGKSHAKIIKFGLGFLRTFLKMWKMLNTIAAAGYDDRAFYSRIPMQRYWQRQRYRIILGFAGCPSRILDAGCGTSKILGALPQAVGLDINFKKLRYNLSLGNNLVNADIRRFCFKDGFFDTVICSEVIEHLKKEDCIFQELKRVLNKGGVLILGTPDYSRFSWVLIEWLYKRLIPGGYADEHISHYNKKDLTRSIENIGFKLESYKYILGSELICKFIKE